MKIINFAHMKRKMLFNLLAFPLFFLAGCSGVTAVHSLHSEYAGNIGECVITSDPVGTLLSDKADNAVISICRYDFERHKCASFNVVEAGYDTLPVAFAAGNPLAADFEKFLTDSVPLNGPGIKVAVPDSSYLSYGKFRDLIREFCDSAEFFVVAADSVADKLLSGQVSMGLTSADDRLEFSRPFFPDRLVLLEKGDIERGVVINGLDDLEGMTIIVETGSVQELYASKHLKKSNLMMVDAIPDMFLQLNQGRADAALVAETIWRMISSDYPNLYSICDTIAPQPVAVAFSKQQPELRESFNAFQKEMKETGLLKEIHDGWYESITKRQIPNTDTLDFPNGELPIAFYSCVPPFNFIQDGKPSGSEVELATRFAIHMGMKPVFSDMNFTSLIPFLQSGKAKMAVSTISVTEERSKQVDFADPWLYESSALLVTREHAPASVLKVGSVDSDGFFDDLKESIKNNILVESRWKLFVDGLGVTVFISLLAAIFGTLLGILLCFMSMSKKKYIAGTSSVFIEFMRRMPQVVLLMVLFYVFFADMEISGEWVAVIGFTLCFGAYTSVIFRTAVESIDKGQTEAGLSMGFDKIKTFYYFILPQVVMRALPVYKGEFIGLVKATSIVGYIAVLDLTKAGDIVRSRTFEAFFPLILITIMYFLVIWVLSLVIKYFQLRNKPRRYKYSPKKEKQ